MHQLAEERPAAAPSSSRLESAKVGYIMSRFPKLTETFVLLEILALREQGLEVEVFPLLRARNTSTHPEAASVAHKITELMRRPSTEPIMHSEVSQIMDRVHFCPLMNWAILKAQCYYLWRKPITYLTVLWTILRANWGSLNYLLGGSALFPKAVFWSRQMRQRGVTHVHAHFANHPSTAAFVIHQLGGLPYSFTAHGSDIQVDQHMLKEKVQAADRVVTVSDYNKDFLARICGEQYRDRVDVVRCGVDTQFFRKSPQVQGGENDAFRLVCVGTLYELKGQHILLRACQLLQAENIDVRCELIGDGPARESLAQMARELGIERQVRFHGLQSRDQVAQRLQQTDVLVAPSIPTRCGRREGIPVVLMEAMASSIPVVASEISGIPELVRHEVTGLLVPPGDVAALASALQRIHADRLLGQNLAERARELILDEYDLRTNAETLADYFCMSALP